MPFFSNVETQVPRNPSEIMFKLSGSLYLDYLYRKPLKHCWSLADKSGDIVDFCVNTSIDRVGAWSRHALVQLFPTTQQSHSLSHSADCESSRPSNTRAAPTSHSPSHQQPSHGNTEVYTACERHWRPEKVDL